ncbi:MAG: hypothetical protein SNF33_06080 [Candidatus Algichlamydia australiensis]|nr:hypothetical protein [Chlamydiales bacterium]
MMVASPQKTAKLSKDLIFTLQLKADGSDQTIYPNDIHEFSLDLQSYGYQAEIGITSMNNQDLDSLLLSTKVITATLKFYNSEDDSSPLLLLTGTVTKQSFQCVTNSYENSATCIYLWSITFKDNAQAIWSEHFPQSIYVNKTMKNVFEEHKTPSINLNYKFDALETSYPILAFSLEEKAEIPEEKRPQFYSFLHWYLHQEGGLLLYDFANNSYTFYSEKPALEETPYSIYQEAITPPRCLCPTPPRATEQKLLHQPDTINEVVKEVSDAFAQACKTFIDKEIDQIFPEHRHGYVSSVMKPEKNLLYFSVNDLVNQFHFDKLLPNSFINFASHKFSTGHWSNNFAFSEKTFRIRTASIRARRKTEANNIFHKKEPYELQIEICAEDEEEKHIDRPPFNPPNYPFSIQGTVFCEIGAKEQTTFNINTSDGTPQGHYQVSVPLAMDEKLVVPFFPDFMTGQHFYPLCKDQQVLLNIYFRTAKIHRVLDWQPHARLPSGTQGNQLVLSSNGAYEYVILKHEFEGGSNSVFTLIQSSSMTQTQTVKIEKESIQSTIELTGKKTTTIEHTNDKVHYSLENKETGMKQETLFDGKEMTHTCEQKGIKSTCTQKPDSFTFKCKKFSIQADESIEIQGNTYTADLQSKAVISSKMIHNNASTVKNGA